MCALLDKSLLGEAFPLVALFHAARAAGGAGMLRLVNDGTSGGEGGVVLTLAGGAITKDRLGDEEWELIGELGRELFAAPAGSPPKLVKNPFTGEIVDPAAVLAAAQPKARAKPNARAKPKPRATPKPKARKRK